MVSTLELLCHLDLKYRIFFFNGLLWIHRFTLNLVSINLSKDRYFTYIQICEDTHALHPSV